MSSSPKRGEGTARGRGGSDTDFTGADITATTTSSTPNWGRGGGGVENRDIDLTGADITATTTSSTPNWVRGGGGRGVENRDIDLTGADNSNNNV